MLLGDKIQAALPRVPFQSDLWEAEVRRVLLVNGFRISLSIGAWAIAGAWCYKAISAAFGLRRVPNLLGAAYDGDPSGSPWVTVIVPACNEEQSVAACLQSLLAQDYANLNVLAVDDRSTDRTRAILDGLAAQYPERMSALHVDVLPPDWLGKTHAMALAARHTTGGRGSDWLMFTDADVIFHPEAIRRSLAQAVAQQADHFVTIPTALVESPGEAMMLGFLQVIGLWATRLWKVEDPRCQDSMGIGAFNLIRSSAYLGLGGFDAIPMAVVEDLTLARLVKQAGLRQRVAFAFGYVSIHWASGALGVVNTMTKNLFAIFRFQAGLLILSCAALSVLCFGPFAALVFHSGRIPGSVGVLAIAALYGTSQRYSGIPAWNVVSFPAAACLFLYSLLRSMTVTLRQGGVQWRGTFYPLEELRRHSPRLW